MKCSYQIKTAGVPVLDCTLPSMETKSGDFGHISMLM